MPLTRAPGGGSEDSRHRWARRNEIFALNLLKKKDTQHIRTELKTEEPPHRGRGWGGWGGLVEGKGEAPRGGSSAAAGKREREAGERLLTVASWLRGLPHGGPPVSRGPGGPETSAPGRRALRVGRESDPRPTWETGQSHSGTFCPASETACRGASTSTATLDPCGRQACWCLLSGQ